MGKYKELLEHVGKKQHSKMLRATAPAKIARVAAVRHFLEGTGIPLSYPNLTIEVVPAQERDIIHVRIKGEDVDGIARAQNLSKTFAVLLQEQKLGSQSAEEFSKVPAIEYMIDETPAVGTTRMHEFSTHRMPATLFNMRNPLHYAATPVDVPAVTINLVLKGKDIDRVFELKHAAVSKNR